MHLAYKLGLCALREPMLKDRLDYLSGASAETNVAEPALQLSQALKYHGTPAQSSGQLDQRYRCDQSV